MTHSSASLVADNRTLGKGVNLAARQLHSTTLNSLRLDKLPRVWFDASLQRWSSPLRQCRHFDDSEIPAKEVPVFPTFVTQVGVTNGT